MILTPHRSGSYFILVTKKQNKSNIDLKMYKIRYALVWGYRGPHFLQSLIACYLFIYTLFTQAINEQIYNSGPLILYDIKLFLYCFIILILL